MNRSVDDIILDAEEQEIEDNIDFTKALPEAQRLAAVEAFRNAAKDTRKAVTMRLAESTIAGLKARAEADGIPYQTLASMILQKYVRGGLLEKEAVKEVVKALTA